MKQGVERNEYAGAVALLIRDGKVGYSRAVGMRDREAGDRMRTDAIFRIASMSKPITSVAAMILVEDGKLALDDPVAKYIPEFQSMKLLDGKPATHPMTVRHLLTHTSGLSYRFFDGPLKDVYAKAGVSDGLSQTEGGDRRRRPPARRAAAPVRARARRGTTASRPTSSAGWSRWPRASRSTSSSASGSSRP